MRRAEASLPHGVPPGAVQMEFIRSRGAGGQNVNKVATGVQLRVDVTLTELPLPVQRRLLRLAGARATKSGVVVIRADRFRTQARNRADAIDRLCELVEEASAVRKRRLATRVSKGVKQRRLDNKGRRGKLKRLRGKPVE